MKKYALITGASAGIGKEFAQQLAQMGWNLVLIARRTEMLESIAKSIHSQYKVDVQCIPADLSDKSKPQIIFDQCKKQQLNIAMLINNAGYGLPGDFHNNSWQKHNDSLQVMLNSVVEFCHLFYPDMIKAGYGRIINVASLAGIIPPSAGHTLYGATKAFLIRFSNSLRLEAIDHGVHVTALCPGFTYTEFHDVNGTRSMVSELPKFMWMSSNNVVKQGIKAVENNKAVKVNGKINSIIAALPNWLNLMLLGNKTKKYRKR